MNAPRTSVRPSRLPAFAALAYAALVAGLCAVAFGAVADLMERRAAVAAAEEVLDRLQGRRPARAGAEDGAADPWAGSPFLEGPTVTVAGAALMQRVTSAVARCDGRVTSSRVELEAGPFGPGFLSVAASLDIAQPDLQKLLYDLEAGQPFLFVDQLVAQGRGTRADAGDGRMQVTLTVYGQWQGAR